MRQVMVRYKVKPDRVGGERGAGARRLRGAGSARRPTACATRPSGWTTAWASSTSPRPRTAHNPLSEVEAFARFQDGIGERCDEPPVVTELHEIGSYRFHGDAGAA